MPLPPLRLRPALAGVVLSLLAAGCPAPAPAPPPEACTEGAACDDGNLCTSADTCRAGVCAGEPVACAAADACHEAGRCDPQTGECSKPLRPNGTSCDDGNACTRDDACTGGTCSGTAVVCEPADACHAAGVCDPQTGECSSPPRADGSDCDDGDACTQHDACTAGACAGVPIVCTAADACHVAGVCDSETGLCSNPPAADGTECDDGSACTHDDVCAAGTCAGTAVVCTPLDVCRGAGTCEPANGQCTRPLLGGGALFESMNLTAAPGGPGTIELSWAPIPGAASYAIYRSTEGSAFAPVGTSETTTFTATGLANLVRYSFVVRALTAQSQCPASNEASATTILPPPQNLVATPSGPGRIDVEWDPVEGAASYTLSMASAAAGPYASVTSGHDDTSFSLTGLPNGVRYHFVVVAVQGATVSEPSAPATAVTELPAPEGLAATARDGEIALAWEPVAGATGYEVRRGTAPGAANALVASVSGTAWVDDDEHLVPGTAYVYVVRATTAATQGADSVEVEALLPAAARLAFAVEPSDTVAGAKMAPAVRVVVQDDAGHTMTRSTAAITLVLAGSDETLEVTAQAASGSASFSSLVLRKAGTGFTFTASSGNLEEALSNPFDVAAAAPHAPPSTLHAEAASAEADGSATITLVVTLADVFGNPVADHPVSLSATGTGNVFEPDAGTTDEQGVFTATLASTVAQTKTVTATAGGLTLTTTVAFLAPPGPSAVAVAAGYYGHSCALLEDGTVRCWGRNTSGQLGDGTKTLSTTPVAVTGLSGAVDLVAGSVHTCAVLEDQTARCWGDNNSGVLGDPAVTPLSVPTPVTVALTGVVAMAAGDMHTCALLDDGTARCWGHNGEGQIGDGTTTTPRRTPTPVKNLTNLVAISAGHWHTCALRDDGAVFCWGYNSNGGVGDGTTTRRPTPTQVSGLTGAVAIDAGAFHSCAVLDSGGASCWGYNMNGGLGNGTWTDSKVPVAVSGLTGAVAIAGGYYHTCAARTDGSARCWGSNLGGQLGTGATGNGGNTPAVVPGLAGVTGVSTGQFHSCAVAGGVVHCWGDNTYGQIGDGTKTTRPAPTAISFGGG